MKDYKIYGNDNKEWLRSNFMGFERSHTIGEYGTHLSGILKREFWELNSNRMYVYIMTKNNPNRIKILKEIESNVRK